MFRKIGVILLAASSLSAFAQEDELSKKQAELAKVRNQKDSINNVIKAIESEIAALKPPVNWTKGGFTALNFNSVGLSNWAAGGLQSNSITIFGNLFINYNKDKISWLNNLDLAYGLIQQKQENSEFRKNEDKIDFLSKLGYKATDKLSYAVLGGFKSQFAPGYDFNDPTEDRPVISRFMAPATINLSVGLDYQPAKFLSIYLSPAAGKLTLVLDDSIAAQHVYIPDATDAQGVQFYNDNYRAEFGASINLIFDHGFTDNLSLRSRLDLFNNYTDKNIDNRKNIDVNWETLINFKFTKYIAASLFTHLIYDNDVDIPTEFDQDGNILAFGPRTQFKRVFGLGFSYKF